MSVSPEINTATTLDGDRRNLNSPYLPRISGANTIARPSPQQSATHDASGFPTVKLQAKMVKQTPLPYQTQEFKPCIVLKKFEPAVRVSDSFFSAVSADDAALGDFKKKRTVILHTDRYSHQGLLKLDSDSQKVRLAQEGQMLQDARSRMRLRDALAHRARHDLHLGGNPMAPDHVNQWTYDEEIHSTKLGDKAKKRKRLNKHQRRLKNLSHQRSDKQMHLGFISEDAMDSSAAGLVGGSPGRRAGQLVSHSSAPSIPALHLGQYHSSGQPTSFVSRSEFDALASLIGEQVAAAADGPGSTTSGLEKVKLDGNKAVFNRRSDILAELSRLKAIVLPDFARDLYVGRGIRLPGNHAVNHPRKLIDGDPVLDALMRRAQQPTRIIDESGNILISAGSDRSATTTAASESEHNQRGVNRQVFAADVTAKPKTSEPTAPEQTAVESATPLTEAKSTVDSDSQGDQQQLLQPSAAGKEASLPQLPEPFSGFSSDLNGSEDGGDWEELIKQLQLPQNVTGYLLAVKEASRHSKATFLTLELGRLIRQRLSTGDVSVGKPTSSLVQWLRRGLDLFHDVDRDMKGSVSIVAFFDILSSMRGQLVDEVETQGIKSSCGLSGDSVSKLAFLALLPFLA